MNRIVLFVSLSIAAVSARNNGVGKLPVMGYDTYNAFDGAFDHDITVEQARLMQKYGLVDAGYNTFILDDYYSEKERDSNGYMVPNKERFPHGLKKWTEIVNKYGISGSAYSSNGYKTCAGYPGGYGREIQDVETWRSWGWTGMIKYDNCYIPYDNITQENQYGRYKRMADAIDQVAAKYREKPFVYSLCNWGWEEPHNWAPRIAQAWRINGDIKPFWASVANILWLARDAYLSFDHYQHGDLDMLEVGNNGRGAPVGDLTVAEQRTHFTAWCMLKSTLLISTDLRNVAKSTLDILLNKELIDINQDDVEGKPVAPFRIGGQYDWSTITYNASFPPPYWAGNSKKGPIFMIINTLNQTQTMGFNLTENWAIRAGRQYKVRDLWAHKDVGIAVRNWTVTLGAHDVAALLFTDAGPEPKGVGRKPCADQFAVWQCTHPNGTYIDNGANVRWGFA